MTHDTDPHDRRDDTEPVEYQQYGPAPRVHEQPSSWQAAPSWPRQSAVTAEAPARRGLRSVLIPALIVALLSSLVTAALTALAVVNMIGPRDQAATVAAPDPNAQEASDVRIDESSAIISATEKVGPAVVKIETIGGGVLGTQEGVGSGFIYHPDGWILTNRHVAEGADQLQVTLEDSRVFEGQVIGVDTLTDLAIVKINGRDLPTAPIGSSQELKVGQLAIAIGSPLGNYQNSVTSGVVSGLGRQIQASDVTGTSSERLTNLIQTDAAINQGNSGGPLINSAGQVIGINTAVVRATTAQGIGFAIPIDFAKPIMEQALNGEELARPWIGIWYQLVNEQLREERNLPISYGVLVLRPEGSDAPAVFPDSPADQAGIQEGDLILALNDQRIDADHQLSALILQHKPGDTVTLRIMRNDTEREVRVTLGTMPDQD